MADRHTARTGATLLTGLLLAMLPVLAGCGRSAGPENAFKEFQRLLREKKGAEAWDLLSSDVKTFFDQAAKGVTDNLDKEDIVQAWSNFLECKAGALKKLTGKQVFIAHVETFPDRVASQDFHRPNNHLRELRDATKIYEVQTKLNEADAKVTTEEGYYVMIKFKSESGGWKVAPYTPMDRGAKNYIKLPVERKVD